MPKMSGIDLCTKIRAEIVDRYIYIIIITAHTETGEVIKALEAGADDFIKKPFLPAELKSRISTGMRILDLESRLEEKNKQLLTTNIELNKAYARVQAEIDSAAQLQHDLLPAQRTSIEGYTFDWLFIPTRGVAGDIFNFCKTDYNTIDFYQVDVAGHGVASALLAYTLSRFLSFIQQPVQYNLTELLDEQIAAHKPSLIMDRLNKMFYNELDAMQFFTVGYGSIHPETNTIYLSRAGHPLPIITRKNGQGETVYSRGLPVGFHKEPVFTDEYISLAPGSRLFLYSDGILDVANPEGELYGFERLHALLSANSAEPLPETIERVKKRLISWKGDSVFDDDISLLAVEKL